MQASRSARAIGNIPHAETVQRIIELDPGQPAILFCNGPQCAATPEAIDALLAAEHPPTAVRYYRGGMHDSISLGLPTEAPSPHT